MAHRGGGCGAAMPMLLAGCKLRYIARPDDHNRPALMLHPAAGHNQRLPQGMRVPSSAGVGLECYQFHRRPGRLWCDLQRVDPHDTGEIPVHPLSEACEPACFMFIPSHFPSWLMPSRTCLFPACQSCHRLGRRRTSLAIELGRMYSAKPG